LGSLKKNWGSESDDFLGTTEAARAKRFTWGGNCMAHFRSLPRLYQVLTDDLHFYILRSRPCRDLEKVSNNRGFKNINLDSANNSICKGHA
jgi:hypothetical protein